jgi:SAM-dependent methyltransferase
MLPRMTRRSCPACASDRPAIAGTVTARAIVDGNTTYRATALDLLGVSAADSFSIARCTRCGFVYALDAPNDAFLATLYRDVIDDTVARVESQSPSWTAHQLRLASLVVAAVGDAPLVRVLDFGCGYGTIVRALDGPRIEAFGFEPAAPIDDPRVFASLDDVRGRGPFDAVILSDVLEHLADPLDALHTCRALLRPHGWLAVSVPDFSDARRDAILADLRAGRPFSRELNPWEHLNYFSPWSLDAMLRRGGFTPAADRTAEFGLRPEARGTTRAGNAVKSAARLLQFALRPRAMTTTLVARRDD